MINGFLLCLKVFHPRRFEFIKDFNDALRSLIFSPGQTPLLIFTLSDGQDRLPTFHAKLFSKDILSLKGTALIHFNLNPPTERSIDKVLRTIAESEELCLSEGQLLDIRNQCNKDLRNAIVTMQFLAAGKSAAMVQSQVSERSKRVKGNNRTKIIAEEDEFEAFMLGSLKTKEVDNKLVLMKDNPYTIFHALGKFLYNKSNYLSKK